MGGFGAPKSSKAEQKSTSKNVSISDPILLCFLMILELLFDLKFDFLLRKFDDVRKRVNPYETLPLCSESKVGPPKFEPKSIPNRCELAVQNRTSRKEGKKRLRDQIRLPKVVPNHLKMVRKSAAIKCDEKRGPGPQRNPARLKPGRLPKLCSTESNY